MKFTVASAGLLLALSVWPGSASAEAPSFDPDQPFRQAFNSHRLRMFFNRALDVLEDHIEIAGDLSGADAPGGHRGRVELKLYPKGKSHSGEHLKAEGWFHFSPDSQQQDFHFRFERSQHFFGDRPGTDGVL